MYLLVGTLAALDRARRSGHGQVVDAAIIDGTAHPMTMIYNVYASGIWSDERGSNLRVGARRSTAYIGLRMPSTWLSGRWNLTGATILAYPDIDRQLAVYTRSTHRGGAGRMADLTQLPAAFRVDPPNPSLRTSFPTLRACSGKVGFEREPAPRNV
ncbi:hypothetical protein [Mycolicibacterium hodleri]|uniref:hypothetical protein n=1 Tax=Mycolicibacterium hodleri TaxID=49897 RepID=UPI00196058E7|nr:hypothetical protein [Mycolicibacterium hodleri]